MGFRSIARAGALAGCVTIFLTLVGLTDRFADLYFFGDQASFGRLVLFIAPYAVGAIAAGPRIIAGERRTTTLPVALRDGAVAGGAAGVVFGAFVLFVNAFGVERIRNVFVNVTEPMLMSHSGSGCVGAICTCFQAVFTPPLEAFETLDLYAELASTAIEQHRQIAELARRDSVLTAVAEHQDEALLRIQERIRAIEDGALSLGPEDIRLLASGITDEIRRARASLSTPEITGHTQRDITVDMEANPYGLSSREMEVMVNVWRGLSDKQIALRMGISRFTVAKHLGSGMRKMNVETRTQASVLIERVTAYRAFPSA